MLTWHHLAYGSALGPLLVAGTALGERLVDRVFVVVVEITLVVAGLKFILG